MRRWLLIVGVACGSPARVVEPPKPPEQPVVAVPPPTPAPSKPTPLPPPPPEKLTAAPATWVEFAPDDHAFTAKFEKAPTVMHDRERNPRYVAQRANVAVFYIDVIEVPSTTKTAVAVADDKALGLADRKQYVEIRNVKSANDRWEAREVWFRANVLGDGVPWYGRKRVIVSTTAPFRVVMATAMVGLPGDEELADAFVENVVAAER